MNPVAGWYADPSGDQTRLRYWDGAQWTDQYMAAPNVAQPTAAPQQAPESQPQPAVQQPASSYAQPQVAQAPYAAQQAPFQDPYAQQAYGAAAQGTPQTSIYVGVQAGAQAPYQAAPQLYPMTETDRTLRLIAFIWNVLVTVGCGVALIPLAWMIPMTVHSYGIYKGTKANTAGFGVCSFLFMGMVSGILLLCSKKDA